MSLEEKGLTHKIFSEEIEGAQEIQPHEHALRGPVFDLMKQ